MITKEEFVKFIEAYKTFDKGIERFSEAIFGSKYYYSLYEADWADAVGRMIDIFIDSHFTKNGVDWVDYWLYEIIDNKAAYIKNNETGEETRYPLDTLDELWEFLLTNKELYFKNV